MNWEFDWLYAMQQIHNPVLDPIMVGLSALGNAGILWIIISVICLIKKETRRCGVQMIITMLVVLVIGNGILKNLVCRQRPCWIDSTVTLLVKNPSDYSFPSGHSMNSFTVAVTIWFYHKKAGAAAIAVATLIAFSRLYNFVHFPTDVFAGIAIGSIVAIIVNYIMKLHKTKNGLRTN